MGQTLSFREMIGTYRLEGRTLFAIVEKGDVTTLHFDLYHSDDPNRCKDGMEYLFDVTVHRKQILILSGAGQRLNENFSADILAVKLADDEVRLVADCSFYITKDRDVITIVLTGGTVEIKEYPPARWTEVQKTIG